mgnify:CR=1 FL=1
MGYYLFLPKCRRLGISDRILVMADGKITKELDIEEATQDIILEYATKFDRKIEMKKEA